MGGSSIIRREWALAGVLIGLSLAVTCALVEAGLRIFFSDRLAIYKEERDLLYRYDHLLGWFPKDSFSSMFTGGRTISVEQNSRGFRDIEHRKSDKPGILFLGDSFVWGYDAEASERFTEKLRPLLPGWDIFNLGVSGYGTAQELLLLQDQYDHYRPRVVFLVFVPEFDNTDNSSNLGYGYYRPYYARAGQGLVLQGVPVPTSLQYFRHQYPRLSKLYVVRLLVKALAPAKIEIEDPTHGIVQNMQEYVESRGSTFIVGLVQPDPRLEGYLRSQGIRFVHLVAEQYPTHGNHWTPEGHTAVSRTVYGFLLSQGLARTSPGR